MIPGTKKQQGFFLNELDPWILTKLLAFGLWTIG
jgi:hypothetical protein